MADMPKTEIYFEDLMVLGTSTGWDELFVAEKSRIGSVGQEKKTQSGNIAQQSFKWTKPSADDIKEAKGNPEFSNQWDKQFDDYTNGELSIEKWVMFAEGKVDPLAVSKRLWSTSHAPNSHLVTSLLKAYHHDRAPQTSLLLMPIAESVHLMHKLDEMTHPECSVPIFFLADNRLHSFLLLRTLDSISQMR